MVQSPNFLSDRGDISGEKEGEMAEGIIVKYGIIGVGMMGREHLINLYHLRTEGVAVVSIADPHVPSQQLAINLAQSFNWPLQVYTPCPTKRV